MRVGLRIGVWRPRNEMRGGRGGVLRGGLGGTLGGTRGDELAGGLGGGRGRPEIGRGVGLEGGFGGRLGGGGGSGGFGVALQEYSGARLLPLPTAFARICRAENFAHRLATKIGTVLSKPAVLAELLVVMTHADMF